MTVRLGEDRTAALRKETTSFAQIAEVEPAPLDWMPTTPESTKATIREKLKIVYDRSNPKLGADAMYAIAAFGKDAIPGLLNELVAVDFRSGDGVEIGFDIDRILNLVTGIEMGYDVTEQGRGRPPAQARSTGRASLVRLVGREQGQAPHPLIRPQPTLTRRPVALQSEPASRVSERRDARADAVDDREMEIAERRPLRMPHMPRRRHQAAEPPRRQRGHVAVIVLIPVADTAAVNHARGVEERRLALLRPLEATQELRERFDVETVDLRQLRLLGGIAAVVGEIVMPVRNIDRRIRAVGAAVVRHEGRDARAVGHEGRPKKVVHEREALGVVVGCQVLRIEALGRRRRPLFHRATRCSSSRTDVRYSSIFSLSRAPSARDSDFASLRTTSRTLAMRRRRASASGPSASPKTRRNTARGDVSFRFG
jgi:hypothetical protein